MPLSERSVRFTGLDICENNEMTYFYDSKLPFGSKLAPGIFHRLSQSVRIMMERLGILGVVAYIDDFIICAPTMRECADIMLERIRLLRGIGFQINWSNVVDP